MTRQSFFLDYQIFSNIEFVPRSEDNYWLCGIYLGLLICPRKRFSICCMLEKLGIYDLFNFRNIFSFHSGAHSFRLMLKKSLSLPRRESYVFMKAFRHLCHHNETMILIVINLCAKHTTQFCQIFTKLKRSFHIRD